MLTTFHNIELHLDDDPNFGLGLWQRLGLCSVVIPLLWTLLTIGAFRLAAYSSNDTKGTKNPKRNVAEQAGQYLIGTTVSVCLAVTVLLPCLGLSSVWLSSVIQWIHRIGIALLGDFLSIALLLQTTAFFQKRAGSHIRAIRSTYRYWHLLTEVMPAPAAIMLVFTGFNRVFTVPGYFIGHVWIVGLISVLAVMMADGIFGYTPAVRNLWKSSNDALDSATFSTQSYNVRRDVFLFLHSVSFPFVALLPILRIGENKTPARHILHSLHADSSAGGWPQLVPSLCIFGILFISVAAANRFGRPVIFKRTRN